MGDHEYRSWTDDDGYVWTEERHRHDADEIKRLGVSPLAQLDVAIRDEDAARAEDLKQLRARLRARY